MRFLWQSNAPWAGTGYGAQTKLLLPALRGRGHEPSMFAFYGLAGGKIEYDGYEVYPGSGFDTFGNDVIKVHLEESRADAVITLIDLFVLDNTIWENLEVPWMAWTPLDADGIGQKTLERLQLADVPVAMSLFGAQQMMNHDIEPGATIYHAVDTDIFKPLDRAECRAELGIDEDAFLIGMVMANKGDRKQYPLQLEAIRQFRDKNPDIKVRTYIHTEPTHMMGGWDMRELVSVMGLKGEVYSTNQYLTTVVPVSTPVLSRIINTFDVLMNCSAGEGFGIPIVEAQACGVPVITHGVTAMPELTINGYTVESDGKGLASHYGWQYSPSVEDMVYRLDCVYRMSSKENSVAGRQWVIDNCGVDVIAAQWDQLLGLVQERMDELKASSRVAYP